MSSSEMLTRGLGVGISRRDHNRQVAMDLAGQGFAVFPVRPDKRPFPGFRWKDRASSDPARVVALWDEHPDGVPALPTGEVNRFDVLDVDRGDSKDGLAALASLGFDPDGLSPCVVKTPGGGRHIYLAHLPGTGNAASHLPEGVDVRGTGGYVLAPGAWSAAGFYETASDLQFESMLGLPEWPDKLRPLERPEAEPIDPGRYPLALIRDALFAIPADVDYQDWVAALMALHHETGGSPAGLALAQAWSLDYEGWTEREVREKWRSFGKGEGARVGAGTLFKIARQHGWTDITAASFDLDDEDAPEAERSHLAFLSPAECAATDPRPYVVKGLIAERDVGCIVGAPGVGKSLLAPALAYAVAQGESIFGRRVRQGGVFYVAAEDAHGMRGRINALHGERGDADGFKLVEGVSDLLSEDVKGKGGRDFRALCRAVKEVCPSLVVIDTLAMAFPGLEENSAEGMGRVVALARRLTKWGAAVILVHHDTKEGGGLPRGHSLLNGALDLSIHLKSDDGIVRGRLTKNRNGPCDATLAFSIRAVGIGTDEDGDDVTAAIADPLDDAPKAGPKLKPTEQRTLDMITEMAGEGMEVDEKAFREAALQNFTISASENRDNRRRVVASALTGLARAGRITTQDGFLQIPPTGGKTYEFGECDDAG